jgi:Leu/Phe-tRNA-protein transferase
MSKEILEKTHYNGVYKVNYDNVKSLYYSEHTKTLFFEDEFFNKTDLSREVYKDLYKIVEDEL